MDNYRHSMLLLEKLEAVMDDVGLWETEAPSLDALLSVEPFAVDTLACHQWLQWIFIPKMKRLITRNMPLPERFAISPYVEEAMKQDKGIDTILGVTRELDNLFKAQ